MSDSPLRFDASFYLIETLHEFDAMIKFGLLKAWVEEVGGEFSFKEPKEVNGRLRLDVTICGPSDNQAFVDEAMTKIIERLSPLSEDPAEVLVRDPRINKLDSFWIGGREEERKQVQALKQAKDMLAEAGFSGADVQAAFSLLQTGHHTQCLAAMDLTNDGQEAGLRAEVHGPSDQSYQEISVVILDEKDNCVADVIVGLNPDNELRVAVTTDGMGDGDKNVIVFPLRQAQEAVEVDVHNSQAQRQAIRG